MELLTVKKNVASDKLTAQHNWAVPYNDVADVYHG